MSPSSSCGINSPPILLNKTIVIPNNKMADPIVSLPCFNAVLSSGSYFFSIHKTALSPNDILCSLGILRTNAETIGT